ncbi:transposase IS4 family protein, partial [mine drainage metagenome]
MPRWGKPYKDKRNWKEYNEELVIRGKFLFDLDFVDQWDSELSRMNKGKRGSPYRFPVSFMQLMMIWHQHLDYRALEGIARSLVDLGLIPKYGDYTTIWYRIHDKMPELDISGMQYAELGTDGTGLKTNNAGSYRIMKYGDPDTRKRKHLVVIITADVRTKKLVGIESHIEGTGPSEPETASRHITDAVMKSVKVKEFYGDGAFDVNDLFTLLHHTGTDPIIKIRKNASTEHCRGSKYQREEIKRYKEEGYKQWAEEKHYGMRWPGTEDIFSAIKRKSGENCVSRSTKGLEVEGYQRFWIYD